jgi:hypothetical protein
MKPSGPAEHLEVLMQTLMVSLPALTPQRIAREG